MSRHDVTVTGNALYATQDLCFRTFPHDSGSFRKLPQASVETPLSPDTPFHSVCPFPLSRTFYTFPEHSRTFPYAYVSPYVSFFPRVTQHGANYGAILHHNGTIARSALWLCPPLSLCINRRCGRLLSLSLASWSLGQVSDSPVVVDVQYTNLVTGTDIILKC